MGQKSREKMYGEMRDVANEQVRKGKAAEEAAQATVAESRAAYESFEFQNPYADMQNPYAENVYEDLTVNTQQAEFQRQTMQQQQANIMQGLSGAAGGSGIAALAQSMANQGQLQSQQISASIGQQEAQNQRLRAQGAQQVQAGQAAVDLQTRQGDAMVQQAEFGRMSSLLGMDYGELAGARGQVQQGMQNQMSAVAANMEMKAANKAANMGLIGDVMETAGPIAAAAIASDIRLKKNISKIGKSPSGLNIYSFEYKDTKYSKGLFQGVMSHEIPKEAVTVIDGYDHVNYSLLDVEFKQI